MHLSLALPQDRSQWREKLFAVEKSGGILKHVWTEALRLLIETGRLQDAWPHQRGRGWCFLKNGPNSASFRLFSFFYQHNDKYSTNVDCINGKKHRWWVRDSNPAPQNVGADKSTELLRPVAGIGLRIKFCPTWVRLFRSTEVSVKLGFFEKRAKGP